jgi:hypothetical protein
MLTAPGEVLFLELGFRQHLDELSTLVGKQALHFVAVDRGRHQASLRMSPKTARPARIAFGNEITVPWASG